MLVLFERSIGIIVSKGMRMDHYQSVDDMPVPVVKIDREVET